MTLKQLINRLTWYNLVEKLKEILNKLDSNSFPEAPIDGNQYARQDGDWSQVATPTGGVETLSGDLVDNTDPLNPSIIDAPSDGLQYARQDGAWEEVVAGDAPTLQEVTIEGNVTNQDIISSVFLGGGRFAVTTISGTGGVTIKTNGQFSAGAPSGNIKSDDLTLDRAYQLPDQSGTLGIQNYKIYTAILTQSGTNAPVATVLENTIGNIVWTRVNPGLYTATLAGAFTLDKTFAITSFSFEDAHTGSKSIGISRNGDDNVILRTVDGTLGGSSHDGLMTEPTSVEIRVYN